MTNSLRALLSGAIDYAGLFPPASLSLSQALTRYRGHLRDPLSWLLGRFISNAGQLGELVASYDPELDGPLVAIVPWGDTEAAFDTGLLPALKQVNEFPHIGAIDTLEFRWQGDRLRAPIDRIASVLGAAASSVRPMRFPALTMYFELPPAELFRSFDEWHEVLRQCVLRLASDNLETRSVDRQTGFKLRCGGVKGTAVPTSAAVAAAIFACRNHAIFWKATAGLHHPLRRFDPTQGVSAHGFLNLLTAAVMADVHRLDAVRTQAIIDDNDPRHFRFGDEMMSWQELTADVDAISAARDHALRSFGSCSIDEPWCDLQALGLL